MATHYIPIKRDEQGKMPPVTLADGREAWQRNLRVRQSDIDHYGSYAAAKAAVQGRG
jgi:hypothetical protein